ncbi:MAG TPA: DUF6131 family protein [Acidimicrobiales bacterium]|nr:DUF6131 family protein [Acidimicrobiales bacterium]
MPGFSIRAAGYTAEVITLGIVLLLLGILLGIGILTTLGVILLVVGVILMVLGSLDRAVGGRRHYW